MYKRGKRGYLEPNGGRAEEKRKKWGWDIPVPTGSPVGELHWGDSGI